MNFTQNILHYLPLCQSKNIGLILFSDDQQIKSEILIQGKLPKISELPALISSVRNISAPKEAKKRLNIEEIAKDFRLLFGHFQVNTDNKVFHIPTIASVHKLAKNNLFISQLRDDVSKMLGSSKFVVIPFGIPGGGIGELSLALVEGDADKIVDPSKFMPNNYSSFLILCDFLSPVYPIEKIINKVKDGISKDLVVAAIARYQNSPKFNNVEDICYLETSYSAISVRDQACRFCNQDVPIIEGEHFDHFARKINHFEPFTFWEFLAQNEGFYSVGHWASDRTPNHYQFRILAEPILKYHCYDLSIRLRNIIESKGILVGWIKKIVCTEGEESATLSEGLAESLNLHKEDVVRIPRKYLSSISGKELDPNLKKYIESAYGADTLHEKNVIIVDQAAHHFKTLSSLRDVCEYFGCVVLAAAVFIDRTDAALSLGEYLHDSHYMSLYSWPIPPRRSHECLCMQVKP